MITTKAIASRTIRPAVIGTSSSFGDERGRAVDLQDIDALSRLEDVVVVVGPGGPHLAPDLDLSLLGIDPLDHQCGLPDEGGSAGPQLRRRPQVAARNRPQKRERRDRRHHEYSHLYLDRDADRGTYRGQRGRERDRPQEEAEREYLAHGEAGGHDRPDDPVGHGSIL